MMPSVGTKPLYARVMLPFPPAALQYVALSSVSSTEPVLGFTFHTDAALVCPDAFIVWMMRVLSATHHKHSLPYTPPYGVMESDICATCVGTTTPESGLTRLT